MQMYQPSTRTSLRGLKVLDNSPLNRGTALTGQEREQLGMVCLLPNGDEDIDRQIKRVLDHLEEKPTELERYIYLIRLSDRNETLFHKVLMSDPIRFLLSSDCRKSLLEIWLYSSSLARDVRFDPPQEASRKDAA
jgi:malate dehydrogenase (oxaloacetate-decarboxylating)(NADP+)